MKYIEKALLIVFIVLIFIIITEIVFIGVGKNTNIITLDGAFEYTINDSSEFAKEDYDDSQWQKDSFIYTDVIKNNDKEKVNKVIWFRKKIDFPKELINENMMLYVPRMSNCHEIYFNGCLIGSTISTPDNLFNDWNRKYGYLIPKDIIRYGQENTIAIRTYSTYEYGLSAPITIEPSKLVLTRLFIYESWYTNISECNAVILSTSALYFFFIYTKMRQVKKHLYFSIICFITSVFYANYFISVATVSYLTFQKLVVSCMYLMPIFFFMFIRECAGLPLLKAQKINLIVRCVIIIGSVLLCRDLISYYIFRSYYSYIFAIDFIVIISVIMIDYFRKNTYIRKFTGWIIFPLAMCGYDIYFEIQRKHSSLGFDLNIYAIMCILGIIGIDLAKEHIDLYIKSSKDGLTGLYTQSFFKNELISLTAQGSNIKEPISLMMLDIDFFKKFNDTYGHLMGDEVLKAVASILQETAPKDSIVTRYGGEEFAIILKNYNEENSVKIAEKIRISIEKYRFKDNERINVTISAGVTTWWPNKIILHSETLIQEADQALYSSKNSGRNKVTHHKSIRY